MLIVTVLSNLMLSVLEKSVSLISSQTKIFSSPNRNEQSLLLVIHINNILFYEVRCLLFFLVLAKSTNKHISIREKNCLTATPTFLNL